MQRHHVYLNQVDFFQYFQGNSVNKSQQWNDIFESWIKRDEVGENYKMASILCSLSNNTVYDDIDEFLSLLIYRMSVPRK